VYDYVAGKQDWLAAGLPIEGRSAGQPTAGSVARLDVPTCGLDEPMDVVAKRTRSAGWDVCVVVNEERVVLGILREDALDADPARRAEEAMTPGPGTFRPHVPAGEMADFMQRHDRENVPITTSDGRLVGLLLRDDAIRAAEIAHRDHHHG
jgi:CBS domain-containing protein